MPQKSNAPGPDSEILAKLADLSKQFKKEQDITRDFHRRLAIMILAVLDTGGSGGNVQQENAFDFFIETLERQNEIAEEKEEKEEENESPSSNPGSGSTDTPVDTNRPCAELWQSLRNALQSGSMQAAARASENYQKCLKRRRLMRGEK